jgi:5-methylcytosine-specific restriction endonuclease McrA
VENKQLYLFDYSPMEVEQTKLINIKRIAKNSMISQLSECLGNVTMACLNSGIDRSTHYEWLKNDETYRNEYNKICDVSTTVIKSLTPKIKNLKPKQYRKYQNIWSSLVKLIGDYKCNRCGSTEQLVAHHIEEWKHNEKLRYSTDNGEVLCQSCHMKHHQLNGK